MAKKKQVQSKILELFGVATSTENIAWEQVVADQQCPFTLSKCFKVRKSQPEISIGSCSVQFGSDKKRLIICPNRLLERKQIFTDCIHLLSLHEPGNELHLVPEIAIPGGSIDYFLASVRKGKVKDFVAIELQTLDTTGSLWPIRQKFLQTKGVRVDEKDVESAKSFGINWKMTAKTALVQLHHKIETLEHIGKHCVLVIQNHLFDYFRQEFEFGHLNPARIGDAMHFHAYQLLNGDAGFALDLVERLSTDAIGIAKCLKLQKESKVELETITATIESKLTANTRFMLASTSPPSTNFIVEE